MTTKKKSRAKVRDSVITDEAEALKEGGGINVGAALWKGAQVIIEKGNQEDAAKAGVLRAGNPGLMDYDADTGLPVFLADSDGGCPRQVYLRAMGYQAPVDDRRIRVERMFDEGRKNEESFAARLMAGLGEGFSLLHEEDTPVCWECEDGRKVTGRPDSVICFNGKPVKGIENKRMSSLWTANKVVFKAEPKLGHLIQAGHYMWQLNIPYDLWYSSGTNFAVPRAYQFYPAQGEPLSELMAYYDGDDGKPRSIEVAEIGYTLRWKPAEAEEDRVLQWLQVTDTGEVRGDWTDTVVSVPRIKNFYEFCASLLRDGISMGPRPDGATYSGSAAGYAPCKYCSLAPICDKHETKGFRKWLKAVVDSGLMIKKVDSVE